MNIFQLKLRSEKFDNDDDDNNNNKSVRNAVPVMQAKFMQPLFWCRSPLDVISVNYDEKAGIFGFAPTYM